MARFAKIFGLVGLAALTALPALADQTVATLSHGRAHRSYAPLGVFRPVYAMPQDAFSPPEFPTSDGAATPQPTGYGVTYNVPKRASFQRLPPQIIVLAARDGHKSPHRAHAIHMIRRGATSYE